MNNKILIGIGILLIAIIFGGIGYYMGGQSDIGSGGGTMPLDNENDDNDTKNITEAQEDDVIENETAEQPEETTDPPPDPTPNDAKTETDDKTENIDEGEKVIIEAPWNKGNKLFSSEAVYFTSTYRPFNGYVHNQCSLAGVHFLDCIYYVTVECSSEKDTYGLYTDCKFISGRAVKKK